MRPLRLFITAALLTLCTPLTSIAFAQTSSQTAPSTVRPLLYAVIAPESENKTQPTSYLYFTLPFAKADFYPLTSEVSQAYKEADTVAVEADISDEQKNTAAAQALRYGKKDHLKKHLSPATWASLNKMLGKQAQQFQSDHAVSVAMGLRLSAAMDLNYQPELAADLHFIHAAQHNEKQVIEFDSIAARNQRLASLSNKEADAYLSATLKA